MVEQAKGQASADRGGGEEVGGVCGELVGEFRQGGGRPGVDGDVWWEVDGGGELVGSESRRVSGNLASIGTQWDGGGRAVEFWVRDSPVECARSIEKFQEGGRRCVTVDFIGCRLHGCMDLGDFGDPRLCHRGRIGAAGKELRWTAALISLLPFLEWK